MAVRESLSAAPGPAWNLKRPDGPPLGLHRLVGLAKFAVLTCSPKKEKRMIGRLRWFLIALLLNGSAVLTAQGETWNEYLNRRFGFRIDYPASLESGRPPDDGAGQEFHSVDGKVSLAVQAHFLQGPSDTLEARWQKALNAYGGAITYKKKGKDWYVISGVLPNGFEYYLKFAVQGGNWASFEITYPHAERARCDPWVEQMAKSFIPFLPGDGYDRSP